MDKLNLDDLKKKVREVNEANGWFDTNRTFGDEMALLHSEVSEAFEAFRDGVVYVFDEKTGKPEGIVSELADVLIRLLDTCDRYDVDLETAVLDKLKYNTGRGYRHGSKII